MMLATKRALVGRKIIDFDLRSFPDGRGGTAHNPVITLDNGRRVYFSVEELEHGADYGIRANVTVASRSVMAEAVGRPLGKKEYIEHVNGDLTDNRPANLRIRTAAE